MKDKEWLKLTTTKNGLATEYTNANKGAQEFGGWSNKGRKRFDECTNALKESRKTPESKAAEQWVLKELRRVNKCDEKEAKKPKKAGAEDDEDEEGIYQVELQSDEDEGWSDQEEEEEVDG